MTKRPDMQVVGANIAHLRREKGLCAAAFAREIEQPVWLIMLLESAHLEQSKSLIDLLPNSVVEELLREICEVYGVSHRWLTTRHQSPEHHPTQDAAPVPSPLLLPIVISPEEILAVLDNLMALAQPDPRNLLQNDSFFRRSIKAVAMLHQLQLAQLQQHGQAELAEQYCQNFRQLLDQRVAHWMKIFQLTEDDLKESASA